MLYVQPFLGWELLCPPHHSPSWEKVLLSYLGSHVHTCTSIPLTATDFPTQIGSLNWANQSPFPDPAYHSWWKCTWTPIPKWVSLSWGNLELGQKRKQSLFRCLAYNLNILALSTAKLSTLCEKRQGRVKEYNESGLFLRNLERGFP